MSMVLTLKSHAFTQNYVRFSPWVCGINAVEINRDLFVLPYSLRPTNKSQIKRMLCNIMFLLILCYSFNMFDFSFYF